MKTKETAPEKNNSRRKTLQLMLAPIVPVVVLLGWKYPMLGFIVPVVMLTGIITGFFKGRYSCGNLCPRGGFFDRLIAPLSRNKPIPDFFVSMRFRWIVFSLLMGFMAFQISKNPASLEHLGRVFWIMCAVTTFVGVVLGVFINQRVWCSFCPMGTMQNVFGGAKQRLIIDIDSCRSCHKCERSCPMGIKIVDFKDMGQILSRDCLKCNECIYSCPKKAINLPGPKKAA